MKSKTEYLTSLSYLSNRLTFDYYMVREKIEPGPLERFYREKPLGWIRTTSNGRRGPGYMVVRRYGEKTTKPIPPFCDGGQGKIDTFFLGKK